ncbi:MAG: ribbon-helix-helix domain-containing protein [Thermodesulfobacteriota bacterium]
MTSRKKQTIITFKADEALAEALQGVSNRSEFIRNAILTALDNGCPLCQGTGILTPEQQKHWTRFIASHSLEKCGQCQAVHLVCAAAPDGHGH